LKGVLGKRFCKSAFPGKLVRMATKKDAAKDRKCIVETAPRWIEERTEVLHAAQAIHREGLVVATSGNVSARITGTDGGILMAVTASSIGYENMALDDVVVVTLEGDPVLGEAIPSTESLMHAAIYASRPDVGAVVHIHSVYASALAVAGRAVPALIDEMVLYLGDSVQVAEYAFPGTEELAEYVVTALGDRNAVLLRNHGAVGVGGTMAEAVNVCRLVERLAHVYVVATALGNAHPLPADVVATEMELFRMRQEAKGS